MNSTIIKSYVNAFNNVVIQFLNDLIKTFPEETEFKKFKTAFIILKNTNSKKCVELFKFYVKDYKIEITSRDEVFFITKDTRNLSNVDDNFVINLLDKLKVYWKTLTSTNKEQIWKYMNTLLVLSDKI